MRLRQIFPRTYIKWQRAKVRRQLAAARKLPARERADRYHALDDDDEQLRDWQTEIDDEALLKRAAKIGVHLGDIEFTHEEDPALNDGPVHRIARFGNRLLIDEFRTPLRKAIREREPVYRKEWREQAETVAKLLGAFAAAIGAVTAAYLAFRK